MNILSHSARRPIVTVALTAGLIALVAACAPVGGPFSAGGPTASGGPVSPTNASTDPAGSGPATPPATAEPTTPAKPAPGKPAPASGTPTCTAAGVSYVAWSTNGAAGSLITTYIVQNTGSARCRLVGVPRLQYVTSGGSTAQLPASYDAGTASIVVASGGQAGFSVREPNGAGGYDPHGPQCAHPATYHGIAAQLSDGSRVALGGTSLSIQCGQFEVAAWHLPPLS